MMIRWAEHVAHTGRRKHIYGDGRPGHRCKDNINMDLIYIYMMGGCRLDSSGSGQDKWWALVTTGTNFQAQKLLGICKLADQLCFSRRSDRQVCIHMMLPWSRLGCTWFPSVREMTTAFFMLPDLMFQNINL